MIPTFGCLPSWFYINFIIPGIIGVNILLSIISVFMSIGLRNAIWNEDKGCQGPKILYVFLLSLIFYHKLCLFIPSYSLGMGIYLTLCIIWLLFILRLFLPSFGYLSFLQTLFLFIILSLVMVG